ncbi:MAG: 4-hydroxythreonine-4-phosphate dehydrogenase PdxA [Desulfarculaceae bacterium]
MKPRIALTLGDPAGVGPEIAARVCHDPEVGQACELVIVGRRLLLSAGALAAGCADPQVEVVEVGQGANITPGKPTVTGGRQAGESIELALKLCQTGETQAMVTCPISKEALQAAGYPDTGHTSMLTRLTGAKRTVMMLAGAKLKVALATIHIPLREVPQSLTSDGIVRAGAVTASELSRYFGPESPRVGVAALNPHAGEAGLFGYEEEQIISPAVQRLQEAGIRASGPHPPDTIFRRALQGEFDVVLAMYHDQGLIPLKLLHFEDAVNVTLGLPIIRTSVDHGTAYDIAGKGQANPASLKAAVLMAVQMAQRAQSK